MSSINATQWRAHTDNLGRVVVPKQIRDRLGLRNKTAVDIYCNGDELTIRKADITGDFIDAFQSLEFAVEEAAYAGGGLSPEQASAARTAMAALKTVLKEAAKEHDIEWG